MAVVNLALRFFLELGGIAAVTLSAHRLIGDTPLRWIVAIGAALVFLAIWALVVAPKAANGLSQPKKDVIGTALLLVAAAALAFGGLSAAAIGFAGLVVVNAVVLALFGQDARERLAGAAR